MWKKRWSKSNLYCIVNSETNYTRRLGPYWFYILSKLISIGFVLHWRLDQFNRSIYTTLDFWWRSCRIGYACQFYPCSDLVLVRVHFYPSRTKNWAHYVTGILLWNTRVASFPCCCSYEFFENNLRKSTGNAGYLHKVYLFVLGRIRFFCASQQKELSLEQSAKSSWCCLRLCKIVRYVVLNLKW